MINLQSVIDDVVVKANQEGKRKPSTSPSNLGNCLRKCILRENDFPHTEFTAQQLRVFRVGYIFEKFVEEALEKTGLLLGKQIKVEYKGMYGTLDFIIRDDEAKEIVIVDAKSVHSSKFDYLDRGEVDSGYAMQQTCYWLGLKNKLFKDDKIIRDDEKKNITSDFYWCLNNGYKLSRTVWLFYVEKECLLTKQIAINTSEWIWEVDEKIKNLTSAREMFKLNGVLPAEYPQPIWECFSVQKTKHKVPRIIGVKVWCQYIESCPEMMKALEWTKKQIASDGEEKK